MNVAAFAQSDGSLINLRDGRVRPGHLRFCRHVGLEAWVFGLPARDAARADVRHRWLSFS
jgi:hypothetical protein